MLIISSINVFSNASLLYYIINQETVNNKLDMEPTFASKSPNFTKVT